MAISAELEESFDFSALYTKDATEVLSKIYRIDIPTNIFSLIDNNKQKLSELSTKLELGYIINRNNYCLLICQDGVAGYVIHKLKKHLPEGLCLFEFVEYRKIRVCLIEENLLEELNEYKDVLHKAFSKNIITLRKKHLEYIRNKTKNTFKKVHRHSKHRKMLNKTMTIHYGTDYKKEQKYIVKCRGFYCKDYGCKYTLKVKFVNFAIDPSYCSDYYWKLFSDIADSLFKTIRKNPNSIYTIKCSLHTGTTVRFFIMKLFMKNERMHVLFYDKKVARLYKIKIGYETIFLENVFNPQNNIFSNPPHFLIPLTKSKKQKQITKEKEEKIQRIIRVYVPFKKNPINVTFDIIKKQDKNVQYFLDIGGKRIRINGNNLPKGYREGVPLERLVHEIKEKEQNAEEILDYIYSQIILALI